MTRRARKRLPTRPRARCISAWSDPCWSIDEAAPASGADENERPPLEEAPIVAGRPDQGSSYRLVPPRRFTAPSFALGERIRRFGRPRPVVESDAPLNSSGRRRPPLAAGGSPMALFRLAVCGTRCLGILAVAWGFLGETAAAGPARDGSAQGRELFFREWTPGDPRSHGGDGLGPLYNETSCVACHNLGAPGGAGPASKNVEIVTLIGRGPTRRTRASSTIITRASARRRASSSTASGPTPSTRLWRLRRVEGVELADMAEQGGATEIEQIRETARAQTRRAGQRPSTHFRRPARAARRA